METTTGRDSKTASRSSLRNRHTRRFVPLRAYAGTCPWRTQSRRLRTFTFRYAAASDDVSHSDFSKETLNAEPSHNLRFRSCSVPIFLEFPVVRPICVRTTTGKFSPAGSCVLSFRSAEDRYAKCPSAELEFIHFLFRPTCCVRALHGNGGRYLSAVVVERCLNNLDFLYFAEEV